VYVLSGGTVVVPAIDLSRATVKGDGLSRAAVNCPATLRVNTKGSGDADLDVTVTGNRAAHRANSALHPSRLAKSSTSVIRLGFCSVFLAILGPRVGHTMDILSSFIPLLCHSD